MLSSAGGHRPANESELKAIREAFALDAVPEWKHYEVLDVEGSYSYDKELGRGELRGVVWFQPYLVQSSLCLMEALYKDGLETDDGFEWTEERPIYRYWPAAAGCQVDDHSQIPTDLVIAEQALPSADMSQIVHRSDELLHIALKFAVEEMDLESQWEAGSPRPDQERDEYRRFQADGTMRLLRVSLMHLPIPDLGFAYQAMFAGSEGAYGPNVTFSVTPKGFVVHSVVVWGS